jgi:3-methyladenine DNA glycosylase/8-oxoguanine DNA glycosylase
MGQLAEAAIAQAIFPAGFYKTKARTIRDVCHTLVAQFGGAVPREIDTLLTFKGVGRKTANLVLTLGHGLPGICVDTHVHRISNRYPCGYLTDPARQCRCTPVDVQRYHSRLSGSLLDHIDMHLEAPAVKYQELTRGTPGESSAKQDPSGNWKMVDYGKAKSL